MNLAYAERRGGTAVLRMFDGSPAPRPGPNAHPTGKAASSLAVLLPRRDFDIRVLDIPPVPARDVEGLLRNRLRSIYPGAPSDTAFDFRIQRSGARRSAVVFICPRRRLDAYRQAAGHAALFLPVVMLKGRAPRTGSSCILACHPDWIERCEYADGQLVSSTVERRADGMPVDAAARGIENLALVVGSGSEIAALRARTEIPVADFEGLARGLRASDGIFGEARRGLAAMAPAIRIVSLAGLLALLLLLAFFKYIASEEKRCRGMQALVSSLSADERRLRGAEKEIEGLAAQISLLDDRVPRDLYRLLSDLSIALGDDARIEGLSVQDGQVQLDAAAPSPLSLMESLRASGLFDELKLSRAVPDARSARERFSVSGRLHAR